MRKEVGIRQPSSDDDRAVGGLTVLVAPNRRRRRRGAWRRSGRPCRTTLDEATTTAPVDCLMADELAVHGAISVLRAGPGRSGSRWSTLCVSDDYNGMGARPRRITTDDVHPCRADGRPRLMFARLSGTPTRSEHEPAGPGHRTTGGVGHHRSGRLCCSKALRIVLRLFFSCGKRGGSVLVGRSGNRRADGAVVEVRQPHQQPATTQARWIGRSGAPPAAIEVRWSMAASPR